MRKYLTRWRYKTQPYSLGERLQIAAAWVVPIVAGWGFLGWAISRAIR